MKRNILYSMIPLTLILASCGGGGGDTPVVTQVVTPEVPTETLKVSTLYDPIPRDVRAKYLIDIGTNRPKKTMTNTYYKATDVAQSVQDTVEETLQATADWLGHYDISYYLFGATYESSEAVALAYCKNWQSITEVAANDCSNIISNVKDLIGSNSANAGSPGFDGVEIDTRNTTIWNNPPNTIEHYSTNWDSAISANTVMHEYLHIHTFRPLLNIQNVPTLGRQSVLPTWFGEGSAEFFAITGIDELYGNNNYSDNVSNMLNNIRSNKYNLSSISARLKAFESYGDAVDYELGVFATSHMVSLSSWQTVYMTLINEVYTKGWEQAFLDNIGMTTEEFYTDFEAHMAMSDESVLASIPKPAKLADVLTPTYPIPRLQVEGASDIANLGGQSFSDKRTIYMFKDDTEETPSYLGGSWPYVTADSVMDVVNDTGVSAPIMLNTDGYLLNGDKPLYQYSQDETDKMAKGDLINGKWHSVLPDGTSSDNIGFIPRAYPEE